MSLLKLKTGDPKPMTPVEFFEGVLPKVMELQKSVCQKLGGRYAFQLFGDGGGAWTLDFPHAQVGAGVNDAGWDLYLEMTAGDFTDLLKGTLDVARAAGEGRIRVDGDVSLFGNLMAVIEPPSA
jgi:hypothetical protein